MAAGLLMLQYLLTRHLVSWCMEWILAYDAAAGLRLLLYLNNEELLNLCNSIMYCCLEACKLVNLLIC